MRDALSASSQVRHEKDRDVSAAVLDKLFTGSKF